jgi:AraC family transcriptional regulator of adaptative response/methylated-DNA-[protein]-cysteine methyltransferase
LANAILIEKACRIISESTTTPSLTKLAEAVGLSPGYFHRLFKAQTGLTPKAYAAAHQANQVRHALESQASVSEAIYGAGFNSSGRFYEKSAQMLGMTPTQYKKGGANEEIRFAIGQSRLGPILVASSNKGIVSIAMGEDPEVLVRELQDRFSQAKLVGADPEYEALVARVVGFIESPSLGLDLPLDVRGTAFQQRVWQALRNIPTGQTVSYSELAKRIGSPRSTRAVAGACAANHIALAIPCHRVVRNSGDPSGYRWGVDRKRALLMREQAAV